MIYCVVPEELSGELYDKLVDYYADDPNVKVIVDRRKGDRRAERRAATEQQRAARPPPRAHARRVPARRRRVRRP